MGTSVETVIFFTDDCLFLLEHEPVITESFFRKSILLYLHGRMGIHITFHESLSSQPGV